MVDLFPRFFVKLLVFSVVVSGAIFTWNNYAAEHLRSQYLWFILGYFFLSTAAIHYMLLRSAADNKNFIRAFMATTAVKLFANLLIIVAFAFVDRVNAFKFIVSFLVLYLLYAVFEVVMLMKQLNR